MGRPPGHSGLTNAGTAFTDPAVWIALHSASGAIGEVWVHPERAEAALLTLKAAASGFLHCLRKNVVLTWGTGLLSVHKFPALVTCETGKRCVLAVASDEPQRQLTLRWVLDTWTGPPPLVGSSDDDVSSGFASDRESGSDEPGFHHTLPWFTTIPSSDCVVAVQFRKQGLRDSA